MYLELAQISKPFILSIKTIGVSAILFMTIGVPISFILSKKNLRFKWILDTIVTMPLIFPPIAVGFFLLLILGRDGVLGALLNHFNITLIFSFSGIVIAAFIAGLPLMVKPLQASIEQFPKNIKEAAYISGKSEINTFLFIVLPNIKNSLYISLLIATARALGEVGITLMLGGNIIGKTDTVSLAIYNAVFDGEYDLAMALSGILVVISIVFFICLNILQKKEKIY
ncbi:molybdate ABC transporter, inner membrane subunit [Arcobacter nitrofigilis DSM 7299]|uniref:Molybdenum transport system permease n=1 Tax=Arcobacter nitrofigilis (strain ATCC 33309 / DSM 7299 / CCUG 15893 / LMG 7604 / NCTC 12251 / CI) TaxID=572480 RepID=D5V3J8_ARCNC|nr:molybdate ABC transporter permease subunit [Arcobacter nitrofigilis]ADG91709.1 molybdate ABC transporter, inner membrane subunit [Arcobacter nitrofigilis DSM 7299]